MCQLFGVSSPEKFLVNDYLKAFFSHSDKHPHGWGIATFYGDAVNLEKEPLPAWQSNYLKSRLQPPFLVKNMIAHIRQASMGGLAYENCHPFVGRDYSGRTWTLAHNGAILNGALLDVYSSQQLGGTDSERVFLHLLHQINALQKEQPEALSAPQRFAVADRTVREMAEGNKLNLLFYDGELLYVHTNKKGTLHYRQSGSATLIATVPLDDGQWAPVPMNQLLAFQNGQLVLQGTPHDHSFTGPDVNPLHLEFSLL